MAITRRRWSLVRMLASLVPQMLWKYMLPGPIRINFNHCVLAQPKRDVFGSNNTPQNFNAFESNLKHNEKTTDVNLVSTPKTTKVLRQSRMCNIQKDLEQLKDQVAKILRQQQEKLQCTDYGNLSGLSRNESSLFKSYGELSQSPITTLSVESSR